MTYDNHGSHDSHMTITWQLHEYHMTIHDSHMTIHDSHMSIT